MKKNRTTKPISWKEIKKAIIFLEHEKKYQFLQIITVGIFTGYRIGDMLELKYGDFKNDFLDITERKTTKQRRVKIVAELRRIVFLCQTNLKKKDDHYLFTRERFLSSKPITKAAGISRIRNGLKYAGIRGKNLTSHVLRKTFALRYYQLMAKSEGDYRALSELSKQLNHSNTDTTRRYIGIQEKVIQNVFENFY